MFEPIDRRSTCRPYALACWLLAGLFAAAVLASALQLWRPQPYLPPLEAFLGVLPPWLSICVQAAVLAAIAGVSWRLQRGLVIPDPRLGRVLAWLGAGYMAVAFARIAFGVAVPQAAPWFRMWIPALMHVVLAGFVLTVALYHRREQTALW